MLYFVIYQDGGFPSHLQNTLALCQKQGDKIESGTWQGETQHTLYKQCVICCFNATGQWFLQVHVYKCSGSHSTYYVLENNTHYYSYLLHIIISCLFSYFQASDTCKNSSWWTVQCKILRPILNEWNAIISIHIAIKTINHWLLIWPENLWKVCRTPQ